MKPLSFVSVILLLLTTSLHAQDSAVVVRLSPAEIAAAQAKGLADHAHDAINDTNITPRKRAIHGEIGFAVGTNGARSTYGTVVAPLGNDGTVALSVADGTVGRRTR